MPARKKRRLSSRRKRSLDSNLDINYKNVDTLKRFITDRGKIIPRRISGADAAQQRQICKEVKRARYLALLPFSVAHDSERGFANEMSAVTAAATRFTRIVESANPSEENAGKGGRDNNRDSFRG